MSGNMVPVCALLILILGLITTLPGCASRSSNSSSIAGIDAVENEIDHNCSYFYFLWGRHAELRLRFEEALEAYEKALICDPTAYHVKKKIPLLLLRLDRIEEAESMLNELLSSRPDDLEMGMLAARIKESQNELEAAISIYRRIMARNPDSPLPGLRLTELYLAGKEYDKAGRVLEEVFSIAGDSYHAHLLQAQLHDEQEEYSQAVISYRKALSIEWSTEILLRIGKIHLKTDSLHKAVEVYRELLERDEYNLQARVALFQAYHLLGDDDSALVELETLRRLAPRPGHIILTIAKIHLRRGEYEEATSLLEELPEEENLPEARLLLARLYFRKGQRVKALEQLDLMEGSDEYQQDVFFLRLRILQSLGRDDEAALFVEKVIEQADVALEDKLAALAAMYSMGSDPAQVHKLYKKGINSGEQRDVWHYEYGLFLEYIGEHDAAIDEMKRALEVNPDHPAALNFVGYTWADAGVHLDQALDYLLRAVRLKPKNGYIRDSLGWVYYRLGRIDDAKNELEEAVKLSPDDPAIYDHLGDVYRAGGEVLKAREAYTRAIELYEDETSRSRVKEKLHDLEE